MGFEVGVIHISFALKLEPIGVLLQKTYGVAGASRPKTDCLLLKMWSFFL